MQNLYGAMYNHKKIASVLNKNNKLLGEKSLASCFLWAGRALHFLGQTGNLSQSLWQILFDDTHQVPLSTEGWNHVMLVCLDPDLVTSHVCDWKPV